MLQLLAYVLSSHEGVDDNQLVSIVFPHFFSPQNRLHNLVQDVAVNNKSHNKTDESIHNLNGVIGSNISIGNGSDSIDSPVDDVEVLNFPTLVDDVAEGSRANEPAN